MSDYCENGKPKDCRYCYYYGRHGCMLKVCYYDRPKPETKPVSECDRCRNRSGESSTMTPK